MATKEMSKLVVDNVEYEIVDETARTTKQDKLVSGINIKTVDNKSIMGDGNLTTRHAGTFGWWTGLLEDIPIGFLVCNGQAVSRINYANLYDVIGDKYGAGDGSTTFNVPNLSGGNGRFIRAGFSDSNIGTLQDDKIRNIIGITRLSWDGVHPGIVNNTNENGGAIGQGQIVSGALGGYGGGSDTAQRGFSLNANAQNTGGGNPTNPMAGHADGNDIHPYNIAFLPLIAY